MWMSPNRHNVSTFAVHKTNSFSRPWLLETHFDQGFPAPSDFEQRFLSLSFHFSSQFARDTSECEKYRQSEKEPRKEKRRERPSPSSEFHCNQNIGAVHIPRPRVSPRRSKLPATTVDLRSVVALRGEFTLLNRARRRPLLSIKVSHIQYTFSQPGEWNYILTQSCNIRSLETFGLNCGEMS